MGFGGAVLDAGGQVLEVNKPGEGILKQTLRLDGSRTLDLERARDGIKCLLRAGRTRFNMAGDTWAIVERAGQRSLIVHAVQLGEPNHPGPHTMVVLIDLDLQPGLNPDTLENIFGLTPAEARLAVQIAAGDTLAQYADAIGISVATARSQLSSIFAKTQTARQAELVALLARISMLP